MEYPKVTKENFTKFIKTHVKNGMLIGIDMPKNAKEFKEITKALYGVTLNVECLAYPNDNNVYKCQYEIIGKCESDYKIGEVYQLWEKEFSQYDGLKVLLNTCFGNLTCGGVANRHYGQTKCDKETWLRIKNWGDNNLKLIKEAKKQNDTLVDIFGTNPFN